MDETLARELIAATRELADALEATLDPAGTLLTPSPLAELPSDEPFPFDPQRHQPPFAPNPNGNRRLKDMTNVMMFGGLYAVNVRGHRAASRRDLSAFAKAGAYTDGRAWNGWAKFCTERDQNGEVRINKAGHKRLVDAAARLNFILPSDLSTWNDDL